jgi:hypothetical protein
MFLSSQDQLVAYSALAGQTCFTIYNELPIETLQKTRIGPALQTEQDRFLGFSAVAGHTCFTIYNELLLKTLQKKRTVLC